MPTYEEWQEKHIKEQLEVAEAQREENAKPVESITGGPGGPETEAEGIKRAAAVRASMVFEGEPAPNPVVPETVVEPIEEAPAEEEKTDSGSEEKPEETAPVVEDSAEDKSAPAKRISRVKND